MQVVAQALCYFPLNRVVADLLMCRFEADYYFGPYVRWNLGFSSPNHAGCFIGMILPIVWTLIRIARLKRNTLVVAPWLMLSLSALFEVGLYIVLCKTYSRGTIVAVLGGLLYYAGACYIFMQQDRCAGAKRPVLHHSFSTIISICLLAVAIVCTGFYKRFEGVVGASDPSVGNRAEFWKASSEMVAAAPWAGWGFGESGYAYMNWFQDPSRYERFITPVNSFLHIGVEYGLPLLAVVVCIWICPICCVYLMRKLWKIHSWNALMLAGATSTTFIWLVCNVFTTLWTDVCLLAASSIVLFVSYGIIAYVMKGREILRVGVRSLILVSLLTCLFLAGGVHARSKRPVAISKNYYGDVVLSQTVTLAAGVEVEAWLDDSVLGLESGKELRRWIFANPQVRSVTIGEVRSANNRLDSSGRVVLLFGRNGPKVKDDSGRTTWIIHPSGNPPEVAQQESRLLYVILPEIDETGYKDRWISWAKRVGAEVRITEKCGQDIRLRWPNAVSL